MTLADTPAAGGDDHLPVDMVTAAASARPDRRAAARRGSAERRRATRGEDDLAWLRIVLGIGSDERTHDLLARPSVDELRLLIPTSPPAAAAASLRRFDADRSVAARAAGFAGRAMARVGLLGLVPGERIELPRFALVDHLATALGEPTLLASVTLGTRRRNRKPVLQLLTPSGRIVGYAKVGWSPLSCELVANEADILTLIERRLPSWMRAPVVLHRQSWRGGEVVVTSPLIPESTFPGFTRSRSRSSIPAIVGAVAGLDRGEVCRVDELAVLGEWGRWGLGAVVDLGRIVSQHGSTLVRSGLWHGDLTPWNLSTRGSTVHLWDWEFAGRGRPVGFDALHHRFEQHRRAPGGSNGAALTATVAEAANVLATGANGDTGANGADGDTSADGADGDRAVEAIVDLYLCELIVRELRLDGQRWTGDAVAGLAPTAKTILERRIR